MSANSQPTLRRIAEKLSVSVTTVSRVLSGQAARYRISAKTESAVRQLAKEYAFVPNQLARGLRLKKTATIGLIIPDISNPFFASIARQVALGARRHGYSVILCDSQDVVEQEIHSLALLESRHVEGVVLCPVGLSAGHLLKFGKSRLPLVLVDRFFPNHDLPYVSSDNLSGAREAVELLIAHGHRRIACLQGLRGTSPNELRVRGYREALVAHRLPLTESLIVGDGFTEQSGYIETKLLLKTHRDITAILALSNLNALGAIRALTEERLSVPKDISIIAFDDTPYASYLATPITTVAQASAEMGDVAVKLLFDQIHAPQARSKGGILLPTSLVQRKSIRKLDAPPETGSGSMTETKGTKPRL